jgi:hypothetical protein
MGNVFDAAGELASFAHGVDCDETMCKLRSKQVTMRNNQAERQGASPEEFILFIIADKAIRFSCGEIDGRS